MKFSYIVYADCMKSDSYLTDKRAILVCDTREDADIFAKALNPKITTWESTDGYVEKVPRIKRDAPAQNYDEVKKYTSITN